MAASVIVGSSWKQIPSLTKDEARAADHLLRKKARWLVDENIGKLAEVLRDLGWNAVSAQDVRLKRHSDEDLPFAGLGTTTTPGQR